MNELREQLLDMFYGANRNFLRKNIMNIRNSTSERNWCALLGYEFSRSLEGSKFKDYYCDVEYNRNCSHVKTMIDKKLREINITCDLLVHSRATLAKDNLIALEMKKSTASEKDLNDDRERLMCLTKQDYEDVYLTSLNHTVYPKNVCLYELGIFYIIDVEKELLTIELYAESNKIHTETNSLNYYMNL